MNTKTMGIIALACGVCSIGLSWWNPYAAGAMGLIAGVWGLLASMEKK
jgi:hypothetical protein